MVIFVILCGWIGCCCGVWFECGGMRFNVGIMNFV